MSQADYDLTREAISRAGADLISADDLAFVNGSIEELQSNWEKRQIYRTETEMRVSVLGDGKFPTQAAKYWQCVREQASFYETLVRMTFEYRRNLLNQEKLAVKLRDATDKFEREGLKIDLEELRFTQVCLQNNAKDRVREIRLWSKLMQECVDMDPKFDKDDVNKHQAVSYFRRFRNLAHRVSRNREGIDASEIRQIEDSFESASKYLDALGVSTEEREGMENDTSAIESGREVAERILQPIAKKQKI